MFISHYIIDCNQIRQQCDAPEEPSKRPWDLRVHLLALGVLFSAYAMITHTLRALDELIIAIVRLDCRAFDFAGRHAMMVPVQGTALLVMGITTAIFGRAKHYEVFHKIEKSVFHYNPDISELYENFSVAAPPHTMQCGYMTGPLISISRGLLATVNGLVKVMFLTIRCGMNVRMESRSYKEACNQQLSKAVADLFETFFQGLFKGIYSRSHREVLNLITQPEAL